VITVLSGVKQSLEAREVKLIGELLIRLAMLITGCVIPTEH